MEIPIKIDNLGYHHLWKQPYMDIVFWRCLKPLKLWTFVKRTSEIKAMAAKLIHFETCWDGTMLKKGAPSFFISFSCDSISGPMRFFQKRSCHWKCHEILRSYQTIFWGVDLESSSFVSGVPVIETNRWNKVLLQHEHIGINESMNGPILEQSWDWDLDNVRMQNVGLKFNW